jgi:hypothetical protein
VECEGGSVLVAARLLLVRFSELCSWGERAIGSGRSSKKEL